MQNIMNDKNKFATEERAVAIRRVCGDYRINCEPLRFKGKQF